MLRTILREEAFARDVENEARDMNYDALQRAAAEGGEPMPPATLRAMLLSEASTMQDTSAIYDHPKAVIAESLSAESPPPPGSDTLRATNACLSHLPSDILMNVLSWMDAPTLSTCSQVSQEFNALTMSDSLWQSLVRVRYEPVRLILPESALAPADPSLPRAWFNLYVSLAVAGHDRHWRCLAASHATHKGESAGQTRRPRHCQTCAGECFMVRSTGGKCWIVIEDAIYDVTEFKHRHPGMVS